MNKTKYIFITGGVVSGLGKGITAASLGRLLKSRGLKVTAQKLDPYLNVDPGTMNPVQHGEVFVTDDGAETDLDLGHYERFIDESLSQNSNLTSGRVYWKVISDERKGVYGGQTIQIIPHVTNEIKRYINRNADTGADVCLVEIGGTVGDIESQPFLEAIRQFAVEVGRENCLFIHVTLVPYLAASDELKSKPTQHSVKEMLSIGISPDIIVCRTEHPLTDDIKNKIAFEKRTSCFITSEDDDIYTANYHTGVVTHLKLVQDELKFINSIQIQDGAGCHQILVFHDRILVPCLFLDRVFIFDRSLKKIGSIHFNANTGPRHGVFSKDGKYLYLVSELSNELFVIETDEWNIIHQIPVLMSKEIHVRDTAAIRLSDDEKFIYVSTRTKDVISVIELEDHKPTVIQTVSCGGKHPRDFVLLGQYLLCANKNTNEVVSLKINDDGTLGKIVDRIEVPEVVALIQQ